jgi:hypothetical protein
MVRLDGEQLCEIRWPVQQRVCSVIGAFLGGIWDSICPC